MKRRTKKNAKKKSPLSRKKQLLFGFGVIIAVCILFFIVVEIALRLFTVDPRPVNKYHPTYVYTFNPGVTIPIQQQDGSYTKRTFNERGWYGPIEEYAYAKTKPKRILVLGDSFTSQLSLPTYNDIYSEQIENASLDVVTIGVGSYSWDNELKILETEGPKYKPDLVVFAWFENDIPDLGRDNVFSVVNNSLVDNTPRQTPFVRKFLFWCQNTFYSCGDFANLVFVKYSVQLNQLFTKLGISDIKREASLNYTISGLPDPIFFNKTMPPVLQADYAKADLILKRMKALEAKENYTIAFLLVPLKEQISPRKAAEFIAGDPAYRSQFNFAKPYQDTKALIQSNGIPVIDLAPTFIAENKDNDFYFEDDGHWNLAGHTLAAQMLRTYVDKFYRTKPQ